MLSSGDFNPVASTQFNRAIQVATQIGSRGINNTVNGGSVAVSPVGGGPQFVGNANGGIQINPQVSPAIFQTDPLDIDGSAGGRFVVDLGAIAAFIDQGGVAAPTVDWGDVNILTPDGSLHDMAALTTFRDGFAQGLPTVLPPGRYTFIVTAGVTGALIQVQHLGAKNLL